MNVKYRGKASDFICPFMSRPMWSDEHKQNVLQSITCQGSQCMAWSEDGGVGTCALIPGVVQPGQPVRPMVPEVDGRDC